MATSPAFDSFAELLAWSRAFRARWTAKQLRRAVHIDHLEGDQYNFCCGYGCDRPIVTGDERGRDDQPWHGCEHCDKCSRCCSCVFCEHCSDECTDNVCSTCNRCDTCCNCFYCEGCESRISADGDYCGECDRCEGCCSCNSCSECGRRYTDSRPRCDNCNTCTACCTCEPESESNVEFFTSPLKFFTAKRHQRKINPSARHISAEIEVANISAENRVSYIVRKWSGSIVEDGSLPNTGFEINTAPASGDHFTNQVREICSALNTANASATAECGLHVHVDARDFDYYMIRRLVYVYSRIESALFSMCSPSRRTSGYCVPCGEYYWSVMAKGVQPYKLAKRAIVETIYKRSDRQIKHLRKEKYVGERGSKEGAGRYFALNLHSWFYRGTVECRMFNGTTNAEKIECWGILWARILDYVASRSDEQAKIELQNETPYDALTWIANSPRLIAFIDERRAKFGVPKQKAFEFTRRMRQTS